jgi:hypothetical protein
MWWVMERPILFSAPMVRALLAGTKTQTRRLVNGTVEDVAQPFWWGARRVVHRPKCVRYLCEQVDSYETACGGWDCTADGRTERSPFGGPGDRLWGRETFGRLTGNGIRTVYRADGDPPRRSDGSPVAEMRWTPSIFMPRALSRITLELTSVRVERVQAISEADAVAEGADSLTASQALLKGHASVDGCRRAGYPGAPANTGDWTPRDCYRLIWGAINGPGSWAENPWVWALGFRRWTP